MPFDTLQAKKLISSLNAHAARPGGDLMAMAAASLQEALSDTTNSVAAVRAAESEALKAKRNYDDCLLEIKQLREFEVKGKAAIETLTEIASAKKGASQKAKDWLVAQGLANPEG